VGDGLTADLAMPSEDLPKLHIEVAVRTLIVDRLSAEVAGLLSDAGIDCMIFKGPVIGEWLYREEGRPYGDSDFLVSPLDWDRAVAVLVAQGFRDALGPMAHPRMESLAGTAFVRGWDNVDLHSTLAGLAASPLEVWSSLRHNAAIQKVGGRSIAVPARPATLMSLALHAAHHHAAPKPIEDLRRGIQAADVDEWRRAVELAASLGGIAAFASGLRRVPEGSELARILEVDTAGSVQFDLRAAGVPTAEALHELLGPGLTIAERGSLVRGELFPKPSFMRWWTPLARRGVTGLLMSYPLRWGWLALNVPRGLIELARARRRRSRGA
jgi:hypothetical protein